MKGVGEMNDNTRLSILSGLELRHTDRPFVHEVYYQGERVGLVAQSPYCSLVWIAQGIRKRFYSKTDSALALVEGIASARVLS